MSLDWALGHRWATAGIGAFLFIFALFLASQTPVGFRPTQDPGFFYIKIQGAPGATRTDMDRAIRQASSIILAQPHTAQVPAQDGRTEERRLGQGGVSTGRSRR